MILDPQPRLIYELYIPCFLLWSNSHTCPVATPASPATERRTSTQPLNFISMQTVGLCGEVTFDGRSSSGGASRALSASWDVLDSTGTPVAAGDALRDAFAPFNGSLLATLNVTVLEFGAEFTVSLTVENFLGATDNAVASIVRK